jgi:DnaK suppressor protein
VRHDGPGTGSIVTGRGACARAATAGRSRHARTDDHEAERDAPAQPLAAQGVDDAVAAGRRDRLAAHDRALQRVEDGSYGRSIRSGAPIPDERLEADSAAELTVQEAAADQAADPIISCELVG